MATKAGVKKIVDEIGVSTPPPPHTSLAEAVKNPGAAEDVPEPSQEELFPDIYAPLERKGTRGGRKLGAVNRETKEMAEYIIKSGADPLVFFARIVVAEAQELAEEYGLKLKEVLDLKMRAAKELAPYVRKKMPVSLDVNQASAGVIVIGDLSVAGAAAAGLDLGQIVDLEIDEDKS